MRHKACIWIPLPSSPRLVPSCEAAPTIYCRFDARQMNIGPGALAGGAAGLGPMPAQGNYLILVSAYCQYLYLYFVFVLVPATVFVFDAVAAKTQSIIFNLTLDREMDGELQIQIQILIQLQIHLQIYFESDCSYRYRYVSSYSYSCEYIWTDVDTIVAIVFNRIIAGDLNILAAV